MHLTKHRASFNVGADPISLSAGLECRTRTYNFLLVRETRFHCVNSRYVLVDQMGIEPTNPLLARQVLSQTELLAHILQNISRANYLLSAATLYRIYDYIFSTPSYVDVCSIVELKLVDRATPLSYIIVKLTLIL